MQKRNHQKPGLLTSFLAHAGGTTSAAFSPDGRTLATGGYDSALRLWEVNMWRESMVLSGHRRGHVAFSPDGRLLLSGGLHADAVAYDTATWQAVHTLPDTGIVWALAFRPDGMLTLLMPPPDTATKRSSHPVVFWNTQTWERTDARDVGRDTAWSIAFTPDGEIAALAHPPDGTVSIWRKDFGQRLAHLSAHQQATWGVAFSPDATTMATVGADDSIRLWGTVTWQKRHKWQYEQIADAANHAHGVLCVTFSPDGHLLVTGSLDGTVSIWKLRR